MIGKDRLSPSTKIWTEKETSGSTNLRLTSFNDSTSVSVSSVVPAKPHIIYKMTKKNKFKIKQLTSVPSCRNDSKSLMRILCSSSKPNQQRQIMLCIITLAASLIKSSAECLPEFVV